MACRGAGCLVLTLRGRDSIGRLARVGVLATCRGRVWAETGVMAVASVAQMAIVSRSVASRCFMMFAVIRTMAEKS